jgi:hypothetical protein
MGFSFHPFKVMILVLNEKDKYEWVCDSCGAPSKRSFHPTDPITDIHTDFIQHIRNSHKIIPEDVEDWTLGV